MERAFFAFLDQLMPAIGTNGYFLRDERIEEVAAREMDDPNLAVCDQVVPGGAAGCVPLRVLVKELEAKGAAVFDDSGGEDLAVQKFGGVLAGLVSGTAVKRPADPVDALPGDVADALVGG